MPLNKLTDRKIASTKGPARLNDGGGLWLTVQPSGTRQWTLRFTQGKKRREMGLGSYPVVTLQMAREAALAARREVRSGQDPIAMRKRAQGLPTFEDAAHEVHRINAPSWKNRKHAAQFISTLETYVFPQFGGLPVTDIQAHHVHSALMPIWHEKPETARRVKQRIGTVMKWVLSQGMRVDDPTAAVEAGLPRQAGRKAQRKALAYDDVPKAIAAVNASQAGARTKLAFELLVLTAVRSAEVRGALWSEFDLEQGLWVIPAARMKMDREHRVPLPARAIEIVQAAEALADGSDLVFAGAHHGKPMSDATLRKLIRSQGFNVDVHGFRTSFRTWAAEQTSFPREIAEQALAHKTGSAVEQAYQRSDYLEKRRDLMNRWAEHCRTDP